jgi:hypothetical protein
VDADGRETGDLNRTELEALHCVRWGDDDYLRALEVLAALDGPAARS